MGLHTQMRMNQTDIGETIEQKFERIVSNKEPIKDGAPLIYNERADGVQPAYDIRTDRFEIAVMGTDKIEKSIQARREEKAKASLKIVVDEPMDTTKENL